MPVHALIHVGQQLACPLIPIQDQQNVLEVDIHGGGGDGREYVWSLQVVSYINSRKVPLSCIDNRVLKVFSGSDTSCMFFEKLLNNGGAAAGIALLTRPMPMKTGATAETTGNDLQNCLGGDLGSSKSDSSSASTSASGSGSGSGSAGPSKPKIGTDLAPTTEIESRSPSKARSKAGSKAKSDKSESYREKLDNDDRFLMIYFDVTGLSPSVRAVWLTVNLADLLAPCLELVTKGSDVELKETGRAALSGFGGYFLGNDQDRAYMKQSISDLIGKAEMTHPLADNAGLPGIGQRKKMNVLDSFTLRRSTTPYERAVSRPALNQKSSSIYKGPAPVVKQESGSSSSASPALLATTGDGVEGDVERSHSLIRQVILASFRLRGISSKSHSDYKQLYQHTFRSMVFAFRDKLNGRIELDDLQDRVQKQLSVYLG